MIFEEFRKKNRLRCESTSHTIKAWKPWEWSNAMAGECGEACNITKKMNRIWPGNSSIKNWNKPEDQKLDKLKERLAIEIADVVIYADLFASSLDLRLEDCIRLAFNSKSLEIGSDIKL